MAGRLSLQSLFLGLESLVLGPKSLVLIIYP